MPAAIWAMMRDAPCNALKPAPSLKTLPFPGRNHGALASGENGSMRLALQPMRDFSAFLRHVAPLPWRSPLPAAAKVRRLCT